MKQFIMCCFMCACIANTQAQLLKKLKAKVDQSSKDVKAKVKEKAETAPDRVIDHAAAKVETKTETKIDSKENKANSKVDKTVDKVDSIKIKKQKAEQQKDSIPGTAYRNVLQEEIVSLKNAGLFPDMSGNNILYLFFDRQKHLII
ncbi:MAG: hypothetical protein ABJA78_01955 [Ferruginibacter sp.]